jgi:hypothetical protein
VRVNGEDAKGTENKSEDSGFHNDVNRAQSRK